MLHLVSGISFLSLFVNLILAPVPPSPAHLFLHHHFFLLWFTTLYIYNSISFTPGLKPTSFTSPTPLSFTSSSRTASTDFCLHRFFWATRFLMFLFSLFFVSGPCFRLSWPFVSFWAHVYLLYRIVSYEKVNNQGGMLYFPISTN